MRQMLLAGLCLLFGFESLACTLTSSTWEKVDEVLGGGDTTVSGAASFRRMTYLVGSFDQSGGKNEHWIVRRSSNRGETWKTVDDYSSAPEVGFGASDIAVDPRSGAVYVIGGAHEMVGGLPYTPWVVRRSRNQGETWTTIDNFALSSALVSPLRVAVDGHGVIYVVGIESIIDSTGSETGERRGVLRRSTNGGTTWTTMDFGGQFQFLSAVAASRDGQVFVAGPRRYIPTIPPLQWQVAYSPNGSTGWGIVDSFAEPSSYVTGARVSDDGRVMVFGDGQDGTRKWLVRQALVSAPTVWETVDNYRPLDFSIGFGEARAEAMTFAQDGEAYSAGYVIAPVPTGIQFRVRHGFPPVSLFTDALTYSWIGSSPTLTFGAYRTSAITTSGSGDIIAATRTQSGTATPHWTVLKLECK